jgi:hypothetical protein
MNALNSYNNRPVERTAFQATHARNHRALPVGEIKLNIK